jgi:hypothetical protein
MDSVEKRILKIGRGLFFKGRKGDGDGDGTVVRRWGGGS